MECGSYVNVFRQQNCRLKMVLLFRPLFMRIVIPITGLTLMGVITRSVGLQFPTLSADESFSWRLTQYSTLSLINRTSADVHPPLYYLVLKVWIAVVGDSVLAVRGLSVFFGVLAVSMCFLNVQE